MDVELDDLIPGSGASIFHVHFHRHRSISAHRGFTKPRRGVGERGVAKAVSKRKQRSILASNIGKMPSARLVVVVSRQMPSRSRITDGELSGWIDIPEQQIS